MPDKPAHLGSSRRSQSPVNTLKKSMTPLKSPGMLDIATANCSLLICCPISRQFINRIKAELKFGKSINSFVSVKTQANWKVCCFVEWGAQRFQTPQCVLLLKVVKEVNSCLLVYWKIAGIPDKTSHFYGCDQRYEWLGSSYTLLLRIRSPYIKTHQLLTTQNLHYELWCQISCRESNLGCAVDFEFSNKTLLIYISIQELRTCPERK